jgi:hypothetical protein
VWISWPVISDSCQVVVARLLESWLLVDEVAGLSEGVGDLVRGGGGDRIRLGVILTKGLLLFVFDGEICLASGEGVDGRGISGRGISGRGISG